MALAGLFFDRGRMPGRHQSSYEGSGSHSASDGQEDRVRVGSCGGKGAPMPGRSADGLPRV